MIVEQIIISYRTSQDETLTKLVINKAEASRLDLSEPISFDTLLRVKEDYYNEQLTKAEQAKQRAEQLRKERLEQKKGEAEKTEPDDLDEPEVDPLTIDD